MSVDCSSQVVWGGLISDDSEEESPNVTEPVIAQNIDCEPADFSTSYICEDASSSSFFDLGGFSEPSAMHNCEGQSDLQSSLGFSVPPSIVYLETNMAIPSNANKEQLPAQSETRNIFDMFNQEEDVITSENPDCALGEIIVADGEESQSQIKMEQVDVGNLRRSPSPSYDKGTESKSKRLASIRRSLNKRSLTKKLNPQALRRLREDIRIWNKDMEQLKSDLLMKMQLKCDKCGKLFVRLTTKFDHERVCGLPLASKDSATASNSSKDPENVDQSGRQAEITELRKMQVCRHCGLLVDADLLRSHYSVIHEGITQNGRLRCFHCSRTTRDFGASGAEKGKWLTMHAMTQSVSGVQTCTVCGLKFLKNKSAFKRHLLTHSDITDLRCMFCQQTYKSFSGLKEHVLEQSCSSEKHLGCLLTCNIARHITIANVKGPVFRPSVIKELDHVPWTETTEQFLNQKRASPEPTSLIDEYISKTLAPEELLNWKAYTPSNYRQKIIKLVRKKPTRVSRAKVVPNVYMKRYKLDSLLSHLSHECKHRPTDESLAKSVSNVCRHKPTDASCAIVVSNVCSLATQLNDPQ